MFLKGSDSIKQGAEKYYNLILNDRHINELIFTDEGPIYRFAFIDLEEKAAIGYSRSIVKKFVHKPSKTELAIKFVHIPHNRFSSDDLHKLEYLVREVQNFRQLKNHPNIVRFYGFCLYEDQVLICMELLDFSLKELYLKIIENGQKFPEELLGCVVAAILKALAACKSHQIIYRDINPNNILFNRHGDIKLCDFGESRILHDSLASTFAGTLCYWPPERFESERAKYDVRADIWSLGITLVEIVGGCVPYKDKKGNIPNNIIILQNLILTLDTEKTVDETFLPKEGENFRPYSDEVRDFVKMCLREVRDRPKYDKLMQTSFYQKYENFDQDGVKKHLNELYLQPGTSEYERFENARRIITNIKQNFENITMLNK